MAIHINKRNGSVEFSSWAIFIPIALILILLGGMAFAIEYLWYYVYELAPEKIPIYYYDI